MVNTYLGMHTEAQYLRWQRVHWIQIDCDSNTGYFSVHILYILSFIHAGSVQHIEVQQYGLGQGKMTGNTCYQIQKVMKNFKIWRL